jgi:predicted glycogen debranching enzyme
MRRFEREPTPGERTEWIDAAMRCEWLESDGLGGYASGTVSGVRSRRYHALLLAATTPPAGRYVLVNGFDARIASSEGLFPISAQLYAPGVMHPDGLRRLQSFSTRPWPTWRYRLEDGAVIVQEIFVPRGSSAVVVRWRQEGPARGDIRLDVRPFFSGRDHHAMHHENGAFRFDADARSGSWIFHPYDGVPAVLAISNGSYESAPEWYRSFQYEEERRRGFEEAEDLASPGVFSWSLGSGDAIWILAARGAGGAFPFALGEEATVLATRLAGREAERRAGFASPLHRAADAYLVERGEGRTIVAGYPWFTDWGRDTFIALRGLCLAGGRPEDARAVLLEWERALSAGMVPNRFPDGAEPPEYNAVDASLWFVVAVHEYLSETQAGFSPSSGEDRRRLEAAALAILESYATGARQGIRADTDGLLVAGEPGSALTWMDARVLGRAITPRIGKPVEVQALWLNALALAARATAWAQAGSGPASTGSERGPSTGTGRERGRWADLYETGLASFRERFWNEAGYLHDVVDPDHRAGAADGTFRPNQILAVGGLPFPLIEGERARRIVDAVEARLLAGIGVRTLAPSESGYAGRYEGDPARRDGAYHQGTAWPWLVGPFVEAWVRVRGGGEAVKREAAERFVTPLLRHLDEAGLDHVSELADGDPPHRPGGCPFQAWSLGELMRLQLRVLAPAPPGASQHEEERPPGE